jgi:hypothetical protein
MGTDDYVSERTHGVAVRGRSFAGHVTVKWGWILGGDDEIMILHWEESATTKTAQFGRNPLNSNGFGPQALSLVGHDGKTSFRSSLRACNLKTPARGPRDFCHGLLVRSVRIAAVGLATARIRNAPCLRCRHPPHDAISRVNIERIHSLITNS